jgi:hypothetical protein
MQPARLPMMRQLVPLAFIAAVLGGCIGAPDDTTGDNGIPIISELMAGPAKWHDPQNAPHAAYNWPTLSNPPEGPLPEWWAPLDGTELPDVISNIAHVADGPEEVLSGGGIAMFGSLVFVPGFSSESYLVDVSDPTEPKHLATMEAGAGAHRGAAFIAYPDGRLVVAVSTGPGFDVIDVTDPTRPDLLTSVSPEQGGHKLGVVPGTPILYNAASWGGADNGIMGEGHVAQLAARGTEIYDLSDPENPELVQMFENGYACHHIYFWNNPAEDKHRAVCAGIEYTQIWDTADPLDPKVIVNVPVHHGVAETPSGSVFLLAFSHFAILSNDGNTLIVGDEMGGGGLPPGCVAGASTPLGHASVPAGALWFYDVSDETNPILQGWFSPGQQIPDLYDTCTAHHGRLLPTPGQDLLAMAFYGAGVVLIDFTDPTLPVMVDQFNQGTDTWEVWYADGYLFTGDLARGMDVFKFE